VTRSTGTAYPARAGRAWIGALVSTINILQFLAFGWLGNVANWIIYLAAHGGTPERTDPSTTSSVALWLGNMPFPLPWWYFLASGLVVLGVAVFAVPRSNRFATGEPRFVAWCTTPGVLVCYSVVSAMSQLLVSAYYDTAGTFASPYLFGGYACLLAVLVSLAAWRFLPSSPRATRVRGATPHA
jgi:hypothetical protein